MSAKLINFNDYLISLEGFQENEPLEYVSVSGNNSTKMSLNYKDNFSLVYSAAAIGKEGGIANLSFTRKNGETIGLSLPWGNEFFDNVKDKREPLVSDFTALSESGF